MNRKFPFLAVALTASLFAPQLQMPVEGKSKVARIALAPQGEDRWADKDKDDKKDPHKPKPKPGPRGGGDEDS